MAPDYPPIPLAKVVELLTSIDEELKKMTALLKKLVG